jgi:maltose/moltooligosaccharide transporter
MPFARLLPYLGASFAIGVYSGFSNFSLALWLSGFITSIQLISLLANTRGFLGSIVSPLVGAWSDRVWLGRLGRRRPFILGGGLASAALMALTPVIGRAPLFAALGLPAEVARALPIVLVIFMITMTFNTMDDIHKSLLADLTDGPRRNKLSSLAVVTDMGGQVFVLAIGFGLSSWLSGGQGVPDVAFAVTGALVALGALVTVVGISEPTPAAWAAERAAEAATAGPALSLWQALRLYRGATVLGLVVFSYWFGVNAVLPLISLYTRNILGANDAEAQLLPALLLLSTTVMAVPMGLLGTRHGKRRTISVGYSIMILAALIGLVITTKEQGAVLFLLAGVGNAASMVLTIPLLADLVPRHHMGAAAGLLAAAGGIAAPLSSLLAGGLADRFGERAIFAVMAVMVGVALTLLPRTRQATRAPSVAAAATDSAPDAAESVSQ